MVRARRMIGLPARRLVSLELSVALTCVGTAAVAWALATSAAAVRQPVLAWALRALGVLVVCIAAAVTYLRVTRPLQIIANVLRGLRGGDHVTRTHDAGAPGALGLASDEVNALSRAFADQRVRAVEATEFLDAMMREISVAVVAIDELDVVRFVNRAAERLLGDSAEQLVGRAAADLGLTAFLESEAPEVVDAVFPGGAGRYAARRGLFRHNGRTRTFLVLHDVSRLVRDEERQAWQRLVRVLSHELNNSLTPIQSIARSLDRIIERAETPVPRASDLHHGLQVIAHRAQSLAGFVAGYARLGRRPVDRVPVDVVRLVHRAAAMETRCRVVVADGPAVHAAVDAAQLEQLLINVIRNAADASLAAESDDPIDVSWRAAGDRLEIAVEDGGTGLPADANLFVPYFTTKPDGTGLGLVLSREIAEAHGGSLHLVDRADRRGCRATIRLPIGTAGDTPPPAAGSPDLQGGMPIPEMARESR